jgi:hypothetical protein
MRWSVRGRLFAVVAVALVLVTSCSGGSAHQALPRTSPSGTSHTAVGSDCSKATLDSVGGLAAADSRVACSGRWALASNRNGARTELLRFSRGVWRLRRTHGGAGLDFAPEAFDGIPFSTLQDLGRRLGLSATPVFAASRLVKAVAHRSFHGEGGPVAASRVFVRGATTWFAIAARATGRDVKLVAYRWSGGRWTRYGGPTELPAGDLGAIGVASLTDSNDPDFVLYSGGADNSYLSVVSDVDGRWHGVPFDDGYGRSVMIDAQGVHGHLIETATNSCGCASGVNTYGWARYGRGVFHPATPPGQLPRCTASHLAMVADPQGALGISFRRVECADGWALALGTGSGYSGDAVGLFDQIDGRWKLITLDDGSGLGLDPGILDLPRTLLLKLAGAIGSAVAPAAASTGEFRQFSREHPAGQYGLSAMSGVMAANGSDWLIAEGQHNEKPMDLDLYRWSGSTWALESAFTGIRVRGSIIGLPGWYRAESTPGASTPSFVVKGETPGWDATISYQNGAWRISPD